MAMTMDVTSQQEFKVVSFLFLPLLWNLPRPKESLLLEARAEKEDSGEQSYNQLTIDEYPGRKQDFVIVSYTDLGVNYCCNIVLPQGKKNSLQNS